MKHIYFFLIFIAVFGLSVQNGFAQDNSTISHTKQNIEELTVFPNPVSNNASTIYITSSNKFAIKKVAVYNVLGKQIKSTITTRKELDISSLNSGVYILKITEGTISETRKLVIK